MAMAELLCSDFEALGLPAQQIGLPPLVSGNSSSVQVSQRTGPGLMWHHRPQASRRILMVIHYDTVYPSAAHRSVEIMDDPDSVPAAAHRLVGPGVADAKGGIAVIRFAAEAMLRFGLSGDLGWTIALNPDEEIGSPSSAAWLAELAPDYQFGLVFEPTLPDGAMVANRKGTGNWQYIVGGRAAHAGRDPELGRNAVVHAARLAIEVDQLNDPAAGLSVNIGRLEGGGALNQVPDLASLGLNVRVVDQDQATHLESRLRQLESRYGQSDGYSCSLRGQFHSPPKRIDERYQSLHQRFEMAAQMTGREVHWRDTGGACDGSKLAAAGLINIDTMGPTGGDLHSPGEYCEFSSLLIAAKTLVNLFAIHAAEKT